MKHSLSCRITESSQRKDVDAMPIDELAPLAAEARFVGLSMRASAVSVDTPKPRIHEIRALLDRYGLSASMVMGNVPLAANSPDAPSCLRNITPHLELPKILGITLVRVMIQAAADIPFVQRAADEAGEQVSYWRSRPIGALLRRL